MHANAMSSPIWRRYTLLTHSGCLLLFVGAADRLYDCFYQPPVVGRNTDERARSGAARALCSDPCSSLVGQMRARIERSAAYDPHRALASGQICNLSPDGSPAGARGR